MKKLWNTPKIVELKVSRTNAKGSKNGGSESFHGAGTNHTNDIVS